MPVVALDCYNSASVFFYPTGLFNFTTPGVNVSNKSSIRAPALRTTVKTYPPPQDLVDGSAFLQCALSHHLGPHFLHVEHEGIQRFLYVDLFLLLLFLFSVWLFPAEDQRGQKGEQSRKPPTSVQRLHLCVKDSDSLLTSCWESWCHCGRIPAWRWVWRWLGVGCPWCANCGEGAPCVGGT